MAFKIKDNLDLYGNQLLNFALQSDSGFPQSPQVGHMFNYTGAGVMANHAVMCVDETTKAFKALAFVDEIATNEAFTELQKKVDLLIGDDVDTDTIIDSWKEVQAFLADIDDTKTLQGMLSSYLPKSGGTMTGELCIQSASTDSSAYIAFKQGTNAKAYLMYSGGDDFNFYSEGWAKKYTFIHSGNYSDYALPLSGGTIRGSVIISGNAVTNVPLNIATPSMGYTGYIRFGAGFTADELGHLGFSAKGIPAMMYEGAVNTLLHSGNIGEYALKTDGSNKMAKDALITWTDGGGNSYDSAAWGTKVYTANNASNSLGLINANYSTLLNVGTGVSGYNYQLAGTTDYKNLLLFRTYYATQGKWNDWKTIAFTDSDITGNAAGLKHSNGTVGAVVNSSGNVTIGGSDLAGTDAKLYIDNNLRANSIQINTTYTSGLNRATLALNPNLTTNATHGVAHVFGADLSNNNAGNIAFRNIGGTGSEKNIVSIGLYGKDDILCCNGNGNVLIGTTTDNGAKLQVEGYVSISNNNGIYFKDSGGTIRSQLYVDKNNNTSFGYGAIETNGNTKIYGTNITFHTSATHQRMSINNNGDIRIYGNLIVDGEVSAGGAGQEGESGDGGAEVISQQLAKGQSTYTITNTIKRSDIAVSLYEWNANNGSWDMCLADISVKDATITVTFGSATSVNHKLVAVG